VLRFIPNLDHLVLGIRRALRASVGVFLGLFLINMIREREFLVLSSEFLVAPSRPFSRGGWRN
jgi:hypothetical protein